MAFLQKKNTSLISGAFQGGTNIKIINYTEIVSKGFVSPASDVSVDCSILGKAKFRAGFVGSPLPNSPPNSSFICRGFIQVKVTQVEMITVAVKFRRRGTCQKNAIISLNLPIPAVQLVSSEPPHRFPTIH